MTLQYASVNIAVPPPPRYASGAAGGRRVPPRCFVWSLRFITLYSIMFFDLRAPINEDLVKLQNILGDENVLSDERLVGLVWVARTCRRLPGLLSAMPL